MTTLPTTDTVGTWLLPTAGDAKVRIEKVVAQKAASDAPRVSPLRTLGAIARRALSEEIEVKLRAALNETLADLVIGGWHSYSAVAQAIRTSVSQPTVELVVPLRSHTVTANRQHQLNIEVDRLPVLTLDADLVVNMNLDKAVAVVTEGRIVGIRSGEASADGTVTVEGVEVSRKAVVFPLTAELDIHRHGVAQPS